MSCGTSGIGMTCLPLSMMITCVHEKPKYFSSACCKSWLAVNVLWHKWHWNDLSSTLHDDHLCAGKNPNIFQVLVKLTCSKWVVAQVTFEWLVFHFPWWTLVCMKNPNILPNPTSFCCHYSKLIIHRTFQFPGIINFITTRCQQLFAKHLLLNITLFYALLHSFFKFLPSKLLKNRTNTGLGPGSGPVPVRSGPVPAYFSPVRSGSVATLIESIF